MVTAQAAWDLADGGGGSQRCRAEAGVRHLVLPGVRRRRGSPEEIEPQRARIGRQIAFYGSTRTYRPVFAAHGWGEVSDELHGLLARSATETMTSLGRTPPAHPASPEEPPHVSGAPGGRGTAKAPSKNDTRV